MFILHHTCRGQKKTLRSWFCLSTVGSRDQTEVIRISRQSTFSLWAVSLAHVMWVPVIRCTHSHSKLCMYLGVFTTLLQVDLWTPVSLASWITSNSGSDYQSRLLWRGQDWGGATENTLTNQRAIERQWLMGDGQGDAYIFLTSDKMGWSFCMGFPSCSQRPAKGKENVAHVLCSGINTYSYKLLFLSSAEAGCLCWILPPGREKRNWISV